MLPDLVFLVEKSGGTPPVAAALTATRASARLGLVAPTPVMANYREVR